MSAVPILEAEGPLTRDAILGRPSDRATLAEVTSSGMIITSEQLEQMREEALAKRREANETLARLRRALIEERKAERRELALERAEWRKLHPELRKVYVYPRSRKTPEERPAYSKQDRLVPIHGGRFHRYFGTIFPTSRERSVALPAPRWNIDLIDHKFHEPSFLWRKGRT